METKNSKIWLVSPKNFIGKEEYYYTKFIIVGEFIPEILESLYQYVYNKEDFTIPFYLRSSNLKITNIGEININLDNQKLIKDFPILAATYEYKI